MATKLPDGEGVRSTVGRIAAVALAVVVLAGGAGLPTLVGVPLLLGVACLTLIGIPLSLAGLVAFPLALWGASVYGAYAVGTWLVSLAADDGAPNRWLALPVGLVVVVVAGAVPFVGGPVTSVLLAGLGSGALALAPRGETGRDDGPGTAADPVGPAA